MNENLPPLVKNGSMTTEEWHTRVDLAACYRLMAHFGMDDLIYNHISASCLLYTSPSPRD